ncbi:hypothetical protein EDB84DRAFT_1562002 [Lactarius hengduanensis]|nr:hypothetical protein EDB84DRAFT_1562002 [Lactarius hengduanensis]
MAPALQRAIIVQQDASVALHEILVPKPDPDDILVKVVTAAQNPTRASSSHGSGTSNCFPNQFLGKTAQYRKRTEAVSGCDLSGILEELGQTFRRSFVHGPGRSSHHHHGISAEYLVTSADFVVHVPDAWSFEDASYLGVAPLAALRVLYDVLKLPEAPRNRRVSRQDPRPYLGWCDLGQVVSDSIREALGLVCHPHGSQRNFGLVRSLRADVVADYADRVAAAKHIQKGRVKLRARS